MEQVSVNKEEMRNFFLDKLSEGGFTPKGVGYRWFPNSIENIFVNNKSPYWSLSYTYKPLTIYELMLFCVYSGAAFHETLQYTPASYDYFHCIFKDELYDVFRKLLDYIKNNRSGEDSREIETIFSETAISLYETLYRIIKEYFSSIGVENLPVFKNWDGSLSDGFFAIINKQQVFNDLDAIGSNLYNVGRALRSGERSWPDISSEPIVPTRLRVAIRKNAEELKNHLFYCIR